MPVSLQLTATFLQPLLRNIRSAEKSHYRPGHEFRLPLFVFSSSRPQLIWTSLVTLPISAAGIIGRERFIRDPDGKIERQVTTRYRTRVKVPSPVGTQDKYGSCQAPIRRRPARLDINFAWSRIQSVSAHNNQLLCGI